jgi:hypothetical protein
MWRRVALIRTDVSEESIAPIITVGRISEPGTTLRVTRNWSELLLTLFLARRFFPPWWWRRYVPPKRRFLQESGGVTSQKTTFSIVTVVKTLNLRYVSNYGILANICHFCEISGDTTGWPTGRLHFQDSLGFARTVSCPNKVSRYSSLKRFLRVHLCHTLNRCKNVPTFRHRNSLNHNPCGVCLRDILAAGRLFLNHMCTIEVFSFIKTAFLTVEDK